VAVNHGLGLEFSPSIRLLGRMRIHWFQHVSIEGLGLLEPWLTARGHTLTVTRWWAGEAAPDGDTFDALIIMGGPMNIYQHAEYPWLVDEKAAIGEAIRAGKSVLGACLGAQLISDVLGGNVTRNAEREIGWWSVYPVPGAEDLPYVIPDSMTVLHWHGDTFSLPPGAVRLAGSEACEQQAFAWGGRVLALQFHLEMDAEAIAALAVACADELEGGGRWVQSAAELTAGAARYGAGSQALLDRWMSAWIASCC
jgi:GMP synthase-like glutamine amidotransferase